MNVVLLDRDGTVIIDPPDERVDSLERIKLFDDSIAALKHLADNEFAAIFITNQAGIDEGRLTEAQFWEYHDHLLELIAPSKINILKTYMNSEPAGPDATEWRKPGPLMILQAGKDFNLNLSEIYMIGDRDSDIHAAINARCKGGVLVKTSLHPVVSEAALYSANNLLEAAEYVVSNSATGELT